MNTKYKLLFTCGFLALTLGTSVGFMTANNNFDILKAQEGPYRVVLDTYEEALLTNDRNGYFITPLGNQFPAPLYGDLTQVEGKFGQVEAVDGSFNFGKPSKGILNLKKFVLDLESATIDGEMEVIIYQNGGSKLVNEHIDSSGVYTYEVNPEEGAECRIEVGIYDVVLLVNSITIEYSC